MISHFTLFFNIFKVVFVYFVLKVLHWYLKNAVKCDTMGLIIFYTMIKPDQPQIIFIGWYLVLYFKT